MKIYLALFLVILLSCNQTTNTLSSKIVILNKDKDIVVKKVNESYSYQNGTYSISLNVKNISNKAIKNGVVKLYFYQNNISLTGLLSDDSRISIPASDSKLLTVTNIFSNTEIPNNIKIEYLTKD